VRTPLKDFRCSKQWQKWRAQVFYRRHIATSLCSLVLPRWHSATFFSKNRQITANRLWCIQTSSGTSSWRYVYKNLKLKWFQDIRVFSDYVDSHCGNSQGYNDCKAHLYLQWKIYVVELLLLFIILFILFIVLLLLILKLVNREAEPKTTLLFFCLLTFSIK